MGDQERRDRAKQAGRDVATGASAIGAAGLITPEPVTTALGGGALIGQGITFIGLGLWNAFSPAEDEKEEDEKKVSRLPSVKPVQLAAIQAPDSVRSVLDNTLQAGAAMIDNSRLVRCSLVRLNTAIGAERAVDVALQRAGAETALRCLEATVTLYIAALERLAFAAQRTQFAGLVVMKTDVLALRDRIVAEGHFPDFEQTIIDQIGPSESELAWAIGEVNKVTGETLDDRVTGAEIFTLLAKGLKQVDLRADFMPGFFARPPGPCV